MSGRAHASARLEYPVGGFFALHTPSRLTHSVFDLWQLDLRRHIFLGNARSALARFLAHRNARRIWLPAYICQSAVEGAAAGASVIDFYPVDEQLNLDTAFLDRHLRRDHYALAVDYFGRAPHARFRKLVATRRDVNWIEDRAQALHPGSQPWGDWELFSPRKLLGVPDGGILAGRRNAGLRLPERLAPPRIERMLAAQAARLDDPACRHSGSWFPAYRRSESMQKVETRAMSELSLYLLKAADARMLARRRASNWRALYALLSDVAAFAGAPGPAPFGFPVRVRDAARLQDGLSARGVFAQRNWAQLPSPRRSFPEAHRLARELVTLPCDHRYGEREMRAVARVVRECLS